MQQIVNANKKLEELLAMRDHQLSEQEACLSTANQRFVAVSIRSDVISRANQEVRTHNFDHGDRLRTQGYQ